MTLDVNKQGEKADLISSMLIMDLEKYVNDFEATSEEGITGSVLIAIAGFFLYKAASLVTTMLSVEGDNYIADKKNTKDVSSYMHTLCNNLIDTIDEEKIKNEINAVKNKIKEKNN